MNQTCSSVRQLVPITVVVIFVYCELLYCYEIIVPLYGFVSYHAPFFETYSQEMNDRIAVNDDTMWPSHAKYHAHFRLSFPWCILCPCSTGSFELQTKWQEPLLANDWSLWGWWKRVNFQPLMTHAIANTSDKQKFSKEKTNKAIKIHKWAIESCLQVVTVFLQNCNPM